MGLKYCCFVAFLFGLMKMGPGWDQFLLDNLLFFMCMINIMAECGMRIIKSCVFYHSDVDF